MPRSKGLPDEALGLLKHNKRLLSDTDFTDLTIKCQGRVFHCHKNILCPRVPFFKACCTKGFREAQTDIVDLPEDDPVALRLLIEYVYTWAMPAWCDVLEAFDGRLVKATELYILADKYDLEGLRNYVEDCIRGEWISSVESVNIFAKLPVPGDYMDHEANHIADFITLVHEDAALCDFQQVVFDQLRDQRGWISCLIIATAVGKLPELSMALITAFGSSLHEAAEEQAAKLQTINCLRESLDRRTEQTFKLLAESFRAESEEDESGDEESDETCLLHQEIGMKNDLITKRQSQITELRLELSTREQELLRYRELLTRRQKGGIGLLLNELVPRMLRDASSWLRRSE